MRCPTRDRRVSAAAEKATEARPGDPCALTTSKKCATSPTLSKGGREEMRARKYPAARSTYRSSSRAQPHRTQDLRMLYVDNFLKLRFLFGDGLLRRVLRQVMLVATSPSEHRRTTLLRLREIAFLLRTTECTPISPPFLAFPTIPG